MTVRTRLINLYGAPGSGKSVLMLRLAAHAKLAGAFCEICPEVAKEVVVRDVAVTAAVQWEITREQHRRLTMFLGHVDYLITDAPLLIGAFYAKDSCYPEAAAILEWAAARHCEALGLADVTSVYVRRDHPFVPSGRYHDEAAAERIGQTMRTFVTTHHAGEPLIEVPSTVDVPALWARLSE